MLKHANRLRTPVPINAVQRARHASVGASRQPLRDRGYSGNQTLLRQLSHSAPMVRRDPPSPDASKKAAPAAPASPAPGPAPSPTPDAAKTDEVKLSIPWDEILKGNTTLMQVLMPGLQAPAPGAKGAAPASPAPAAPAGPTAGTGTAPPAAAPTAAPAGAGPAAPSRLSLKDFGNFSVGLILGFPDLKSDIAPDAPPSALQQSIQTGEIINYSMTGKLPTAYKLDVGKLVGASWGLFAKYVAPDMAAKIARGMSGKSAGGGLSYELNGVLLPDFSGAGVSFTLKFGGGKAPTKPAADPAPVQHKLKVGSTSDPLEAEADRVADQVMRMSDPGIGPAEGAGNVLQRKCAGCEDEDTGNTTAMLSRKESSGAAGLDEAAAPSIVHDVLGSPGQPLEGTLRKDFERRFGQDFSDVRIYSDATAAESARSIGALAYTAGPSIAFASGQFQPGTDSGRRLLAHELAHVVQQTGKAPPPGGTPLVQRYGQYPSCTDRDHLIPYVWKGMPRAFEFMKSAIALASATPLTPATSALITKFFGTDSLLPANLALINQNLLKVQASLNSVMFHCSKKGGSVDSGAVACIGQDAGTSPDGNRDVTLCFDANTIPIWADVDANAYTLIHENAHRALQQTYGHAWEGRFNNCGSGPPVGKLYQDNPSSYGCFAYEAFSLSSAAAPAPAPPAVPAPRPQPKLAIGAVDDPLEAEADRVADQVMRMPNSALAGTVQRKCAACEEEDKKVHAKTNGQGQAGSDAPDIVNQALSSPGQSLDPGTRALFESRFGADFSQVRIHTNSLAAQSADAVHARAYATGNHIVLGAGESSRPGHLLAHELAHVVQNDAAPARDSLHRDPADVPEMDSKLKAALETAPEPDWKTAATVLNGYSPDDILKRLGPLSAAQRASIHAAALTSVGADSRVAQLTDPSFQNTADAHFFTQDNFDNRFEGVVDPTSKTVTLLFRVKFEFMDGIRFGAAAPGAPGWQAETTAGKEKFKADFKSVVESTWSGKGTVHPKCPLAGVSQLQTKVVVSVVESGQHTTFKVTNLGATRSAVSDNQGQLDVNDNSSQTKSSQVSDPTGKTPVQTTTTQTASTHEFGHAIGLPHVHCASGDDPCYGVTEEERRDVMGAGNVVQVVQRNGAVKHDDFIPFERIAKRWGNDVAGSQANCNEWSAV